MTQVHFIQHLRVLKHPRLAEYLEAQDRLDQISCECERLIEQLQTIVPSTPQNLEAIGYLADQYRAASKQRNSSLSVIEELSNQIIESLAQTRKRIKK